MTDFHFNFSNIAEESWSFKVRSLKSALEGVLAEMIADALGNRKNIPLLRQSLLCNRLMLDMYLKNTGYITSGEFIRIEDGEDWYETHVFFIAYDACATYEQIELSLVSFCMFQVDQAIRNGLTEVCVNVPGGLRVDLKGLI